MSDRGKKKLQDANVSGTQVYSVEAAGIAAVPADQSRRKELEGADILANCDRAGAEWAVV